MINEINKFILLFEKINIQINLEIVYCGNLLLIWNFLGSKYTL